MQNEQRHANTSVTGQGRDLNKTKKQNPEYLPKQNRLAVIEFTITNMNVYSEQNTSGKN